MFTKSEKHKMLWFCKKHECASIADATFFVAIKRKIPNCESSWGFDLGLDIKSCHEVLEAVHTALWWDGV